MDSKTFKQRSRQVLLTAVERLKQCTVSVPLADTQKTVHVPMFEQLEYDQEKEVVRVKLMVAPSGGPLVDRQKSLNS